MTAERAMTDFEQLMGGVGSVMLHWCFLEDELTETIRRLRIESEGAANFIRVRGSFGDRMSEWRGLLSQKTRRNLQLAEEVAELANEMEHLRGTRNLIAHDLAGASASPDDDQPYIWCAARQAPGSAAEPKRITLADLRAMIEAMEQCRNRLKTIGRQA
jgi:hypothetical protein